MDVTRVEHVLMKEEEDCGHQGEFDGWLYFADAWCKAVLGRVVQCASPATKAHRRIFVPPLESLTNAS